jgi:hypothetical protein
LKLSQRLVKCFRPCGEQGGMEQRWVSRGAMEKLINLLVKARKDFLEIKDLNSKGENVISCKLLLIYFCLICNK